jgi:hypothetical protein
MHNAGIHMLFSRFDFAPNRLVRHFHDFGGLVHRACPNDVFQDLGPAFSDDDVVVFIYNPLA